MDGFVYCFKNYIADHLKTNPNHQKVASIVWKCINSALVYASTLDYTIHNLDFKRLIEKCAKAHGVEGGIGDIQSDVDLPGANSTDFDDNGSLQTVFVQKTTILFVVILNLITFTPRMD